MTSPKASAQVREVEALHFVMPAGTQTRWDEPILATKPAAEPAGLDAQLTQAIVDCAPAADPIAAVIAAHDAANNTPELNEAANLKMFAALAAEPAPCALFGNPEWQMNMSKALAEPAPVAQGGNLYADRDAMALGNYYLRHVDRMTVEGLHAKSDIAAELAWRDATIADHARRVAEMQQTIDTAIGVLDHSAETIEGLEASLAACRAELDAWAPIMQEVERRADKEWCITDQCDFAVTVTYEDFARIEAMRQEAPHAE